MVDFLLLGTFLFGKGPVSVYTWTNPLTTIWHLCLVIPFWEEKSMTNQGTQPGRCYSRH
jgi:hypothetical protein